MRGKPYFKGLTKTQTRERVRGEVNPHPLNVEFSSEFVSDLIEEKHYFCSRHNLRPIKFRKIPRQGGGYNFEGYFDGHGWHKVSWNKCITPPNFEKWVVEALRCAIQPIMFSYKQNHKTCEKCGVKESEDVDHIEPEFKDIASQAIDLMDEKEWDDAFYKFDWWDKRIFRLPDNSKALSFTLDSHKTAKLQAVCKECHKKNSDERKKSNKLIQRDFQKVHDFCIRKKSRPF